MDADRLVIIDPAFLGDVVFDAPLVAKIRAHIPGAFVGLVVRPPAEGVARAIAGVDRVHVFDKKKRDRGLTGVRRVARELRAARYQVALIPHPSLRSAMLAVSARIPVRIGSTKGPLARWLLTEHRPAEPADTFVGARLRLFEPQMSFPDTLAGTMVAGGSVSRAARRRVGLALGSQWPTKRWSIARAAELVAGLDPERVELVLVGSSDERALFEALDRAVPGTIARSIDTIGSSVDEMIAALASCDVVLAGDTGPLHIARALGVPVIALFGPTRESRHTFAALDRVLAVELSCRPCSEHGGLTCPEGHHRCMIELDARSALASFLTAERSP